MLLSNSRIEKNDKIHFYEQDLLLDDHVYSGNIQVTLDIDYVCPGIGIALVSDEGLSLSEDGETYLFRIGHSDFNLIRRLGDKMEILENGPVVNVKPFKKNLILQIKKINNRVSFYVNNKLVTKKYLPTELNTFMVGYYSNAGNIINSISIASEIPNGWVVNMSNTNGGYVKFYPNQFSVTNCSDKAEIEQVKIKLKANTEKHKYYYLKYESENINSLNDIEPYVFLSNDDRYIDKEKNILDKHNRFSLKKDTEINLKFVGTIGTIKNVQITDREDDFYVGTDYEMTEVKESLIKIKTKDLTKIEWTGVIYGTPQYKVDNIEQEHFGVVRDSKKIYSPKDCKVKVDKETYYNYTIDIGSNIEKSLLTIKHNDEISTIKLDIIDVVTIFENIDAIINKLILYKKDGTVVDVIGENTRKQYIPASIKSPIIVTTEDGEPLDLSSSYRIVNDNDSIRYEFTNFEREIFEPKNRIRLENKPSSKLDTIIVYGILKDSNTYYDNLMIANKKGTIGIDKYCDAYEVIRESQFYRLEKNTGLIVLTDQDDYAISSKYKELVVDYLKDDSYAINYKHELNSYEVDISTSKNTKIYYDNMVSSSNNGIVNINEYKLLDTAIKNNSYIVLRGRWLNEVLSKHT